MKLLSKDATPEMAARYLEKVNKSSDDFIQRNGGSVLYYCFQINPGLEQKMKDMGINVEVMSEMLQQVIEEERRDAAEKAEKVGERKKAEDVAEKMLKKDEPIERIIEYTDLSFQSIITLAKRIGITSLQV